MQPKPTISFLRRGLPGLLCIAAGIGLTIAFRNSSLWNESVKQIVVPVALLLAVGGAPLVSSYVHQRPWRAMRHELLSVATLLTGLLGWQVSSWLGAL
jgi:hypothetical protein